MMSNYWRFIQAYKLRINGDLYVGRLAIIEGDMIAITRQRIHDRQATKNLGVGKRHTTAKDSRKLFVKRGQMET